MTVQVRTFSSPKPLGERLAEATPEALTPRTIPEQLTQVVRSNGIVKPDNSYKKFPMAAYFDVKQTGGITFAAQDRLPKLPIPELETTIDKYLTALRPLQTPREHSDTRHAVDEFLKTDGPELQARLKTYAQGKTSYIEQFCKSSSCPLFDTYTVVTVMANMAKGTTRTSTLTILSC